MIFIGLGANLPSSAGGPEVTLAAAVRQLSDFAMTVERLSPFYLSAPVPASDQPWFVNAVAAVSTSLEPRGVLDALMEIEKKFGRARGDKNAARVLDLDLLDYNRAVIADETLTLPHPRLHERAFVLLPLHDIAPDWIHPVKRKNIRAMISALGPEQKIERLVD
jgi:2-amino-4-hydroxy-6-hydroxymethyldihydropteridine diphosphokinase